MSRPATVSRPFASEYSSPQSETRLPDTAPFGSSVRILGASRFVSQTFVGQAELDCLMTHALTHPSFVDAVDWESPTRHQEPCISTISRISRTDLDVLRRQVGGPPAPELSR